MDLFDKLSLIISTLSLFCSCLGYFLVFISIVFLYRQTQVQRNSHLVSTLNVIQEQWNSETMRRARYSFCTAWINGSQEFTPIAEYIAEYFEEIGIYQKYKAIPAAIIWDAQSWYIEQYYFMFRNGIKETRIKHKDPTLYVEFENLFTVISKESKKRGVYSGTFSDDELKVFAKTEINTITTLSQLKDSNISIGNDL
jgi:hypothetical protein